MAHWLIERPIAHRGLHDGNRTIYENSLSAFDNAADNGFSIECDVQISADGVPVVFHDATLDRLTSEKGPVRHRTISELSKINIGDSNDKISPLIDYLALVAGRVPVILELKGICEEDDAGFVETVADDLTNYGGETALMAFEHWLVRDMQAFIPECLYGLTAKGDNSYYDEHMRAALDYDIDFVSYDVNDLPCAFVNTIRHKYRLPVITWTVRDIAAMKKTYKYADQITFELFDPSRSLFS